MDCDVLLLTEVHEFVDLPGHAIHLSESEMQPGRRWAGIAGRGEKLSPLPDPHPASAMATSSGWTYASSILPWRSCGNQPPWVGGRLVEKTIATVETLAPSLPPTRLIWGGDWNHALQGREYVGTTDGRAFLLRWVNQLGLQVPTSDLPAQGSMGLSIDHIAVPTGLTVVNVARRSAEIGGKRLSDHDAYLVEIIDSAAR